MISNNGKDVYCEKNESADMFGSCELRCYLNRQLAGSGGMSCRGPSFAIGRLPHIPGCPILHSGSPVGILPLLLSPALKIK